MSESVRLKFSALGPRLNFVKWSIFRFWLSHIILAITLFASSVSPWLIFTTYL